MKHALDPFCYAWLHAAYRYRLANRDLPSSLYPRILLLRYGLSTFHQIGNSFGTSGKGLRAPHARSRCLGKLRDARHQTSDGRRSKASPSAARQSALNHLFAEFLG
jgi:hypothetical protein